MSSTLNLHYSEYGLSTKECLLATSTLSCLPLGIRHHEMAEQTAPNNWTHHCLCVLHSIPCIGLITGLADCSRRWKKNQIGLSHNNITDVANTQLDQAAPQFQQMSSYPQPPNPQQNNYLGHNEDQTREIFSEALKTPPSNQHTADFHEIIPVFITPQSPDATPYVDELELEQNNLADPKKLTNINKYLADLMSRKSNAEVQKRSIAIIGRSYASSSRASQQSIINAPTAIQEETLSSPPSNESTENKNNSLQTDLDKLL